MKWHDVCLRRLPGSAKKPIRELAAKEKDSQAAQAAEARALP
jgi:hypothetical protein